MWVLKSDREYQGEESNDTPKNLRLSFVRLYNLKIRRYSLVDDFRHHLHSPSLLTDTLANGIWYFFSHIIIPVNKGKIRENNNREVVSASIQQHPQIITLHPRLCLNSWSRRASIWHIARKKFLSVFPYWMEIESSSTSVRWELESRQSLSLIVFFLHRSSQPDNSHHFPRSLVSQTDRTSNHGK